MVEPPLRGAAPMLSTVGPITAETTPGITPASTTIATGQDPQAVVRIAWPPCFKLSFCDVSG